MVTKKSEHTVHVRLDSPVTKRRMVLQGAIDSVALLKRYDSIKRIRLEKEMAYGEFRKVLASVNRLVKDIRVKEMPLDSEDLKGYKIVKKKTLADKIVGKAKKTVKKEVEEPRAPLDRQMEELQRKLRSL